MYLVKFKKCLTPWEVRCAHVHLFWDRGSMYICADELHPEGLNLLVM